MTPRNQIVVGDVRQVLGSLAPGSVDCVVTSPPYFALRNYQVRGQMGQEQTVEVGSMSSAWWPEAWPESSGPRDRSGSTSVTPTPATLATALRPRACCWVLSAWPSPCRLTVGSSGTRSSGPRPIPSLSQSADRLTATWEVVYFLVRQKHYYFDLDAIRIPHRTPRALDTPISPGRRRHRRGLARWLAAIVGSPD